MALINCPECNREISDKSNVCIHCGCPISTNNQNNASAKNIVQVFEEFAATATLHSHAESIYIKVENEVKKIKASNPENIANDEIAKGIIEGLGKAPQHLSWMAADSYCKLIDYKALSEDALNYCTDKLFETLSVKKYYSDGSGGYCYIQIFYYPSFMLMKYGSESNKEKLMEVLKHPYMCYKSGYEYIAVTYKQNGGKEEIPKFDNDIENNNATTSIPMQNNNVGKNNGLKIFGIIAIIVVIISCFALCGKDDPANSYDGKCDNCGRKAKYGGDGETEFCQDCFESFVDYVFD